MTRVEKEHTDKNGHDRKRRRPIFPFILHIPIPILRIRIHMDAHFLGNPDPHKSVKLDSRRVIRELLRLTMDP
jgi:hypothetical protein